MIFTCLDTYSNNNSSNKSRNDTNMRMFFSLKNGNFVADFLAIPNFSLNFALKKVSLIKRFGWTPNNKTPIPRGKG